MANFDPRVSTPVMRELVLERLHVAAGVNVSRSLMEEVELKTWMEPTLDRLAVQLRAQLLGHKLVDEHHRVVYSFPATWWDHLKQRLSRWETNPPLVTVHRVVRWWLRRHPVREDAKCVSFSFREWATFPEVSARYPRELGPVHVLQQAEIEAPPLPVEEYPHEAARLGVVPGRKIWPHEQEKARVVIEMLKRIQRDPRGDGSYLVREAFHGLDADSETLHEVFEELRRG